MKTPMNILLVDDEKDLRDSLSKILDNHFTNATITQAQSGNQAFELFKKDSFDIVLMDVKMPDGDGLSALDDMRSFDPRVTIIMMTAHGSIHDAIQAIKKGAFDYLEKPIDFKKLFELMEQAVKARSMVVQLGYSSPVLEEDLETEIIGQSKKMKDIFELVQKLAQVDTTVLVRGENGTGKEIMANAIHVNSLRKKGRFIAINCAAIPDGLVESELFGHEKGAFTGATERKIGKFQLANDGTLFLDEIAELKPEIQVKLLRVLQEKSFLPIGASREVRTNARIIAATNRNLEKMIDDGSFREDLFYRLNVMPIFLPPLRERLDDLHDLVMYMIRKFNQTHPHQKKGISPEAINNLKKHHWPGNIRELENVIERSFVISSEPYIQLQDVPEQVPPSDTATNISQRVHGQMDFDKFKEETEKEFIIRALIANQGRINRTVAFANIPKNTLLRKIKKYEINVKKLVDSQ